MITTCTGCGKGYEVGSEEQANEQERFCPKCCLDKAHKSHLMALTTMATAINIEVTLLKLENKEIKERLKNLEGRLGIHNPCADG